MTVSPPDLVVAGRRWVSIYPRFDVPGRRFAWWLLRLWSYRFVRSN